MPEPAVEPGPPILGRLFVWLLMTPVIALLPLVLCTAPLLIPAAIFAQVRAAAYGIEKDPRWAIRIAVGIVYGSLQLLIVSLVLKHFGVLTFNDTAVFVLCVPILFTTYAGFRLADPVWSAAGSRIMRVLRRLHRVERNEELPCQRLMEAAEWVFYLELPPLALLSLFVFLAGRSG